MNTTASSVARVTGLFLVIASALLGCSAPLDEDEETGETTAALMESGEACIVTAPGGANGTGHTGFMVQTGVGRYTVGATENPTGSAVIAAGEDIGYWEQHNLSREGARRVLKAKRADLDSPYTAIACRTIDGPDLVAAAAARKAARTGGYRLIGKNCANDTWNVIRAYGAKLPYLQQAPLPNDWYRAVQRPAYGFVDEKL